jgi:methionyl-tRNA formyltransferase
MKICFLTKKDKLGVSEAISITENITKNIDIFEDDSTKSFPLRYMNENYDLLISYISTCIVPREVLKKTKKWNINFHPGPPEYPGIGCFNFAIYNSAKQFGTTAHLMTPKVDSGKIIGIKRFDMDNEETVESLSIKTYSTQLVLFKEVIKFIEVNNSLPSSDEKWKRKPYKRNELEKLAEIDSNMTKAETDKRIRATYYPGKPAPFTEIKGYRFEYNPNR